MLEVKNLVKVYKPKKGKEVRALNDVSIKFPEKGLVFILGKSGCGKSTLLNMLGGLDRVDSGEIIIKGKSSKDFSQADFDSYRNTYLGFIFQEYNILNEFTVGANVGLALELQGKKATKEAINDILRQVELEDYASRKPMQLSGGQKQRIAIARALVKNPEIILADEPTGALDSKTGIQVFDTLKALSKDKLVIVVSHDREFAESYGDRVIELKDGEVISDIEKYVAESEKKNDAIAVIDDKIIQIKQGYELTKEDVKMINDYLQRNNAIISIDETSNRDLKKFARIDDSGNKECFKDTDESEIVYEKQQKFRLIKSRLPFKDSFKIGASGLKAKPVRLIISIILSFAAFTLFGLADTINAYNKYTATTNSLIDSEVQNISFVKQNIIHESTYDSETVVKMTDDDLELLKQKTGLTYDGVYASANGIQLSSNTVNSIDYGSLYSNQLNGILEWDESSASSYGYTIYGHYPISFDEVAISEYVYQAFKNYGWRASDNSRKIEKDDARLATPSAFLNENPTLTIDGKEYHLVGIIDTKFSYNHFSSLAQESTQSGMIMNYILLQELQATTQYGYHGQLFVKRGFIDANKETTDEIGIKLSGQPYVNLNYYSKDQTSTNYVSVSSVTSLAKLQEKSIQYSLVSGSSIGQYDFMINMDTYKQWLRNYYASETGEWDDDKWTTAPAWIKSKATNEKEEELEKSYFLEYLIPKAKEAGFVYGSWVWDSGEGKSVWTPEPTAESTWTDDEKVGSIKNYLSQLTSYTEATQMPEYVTTQTGVYLSDYWYISSYLYYLAEYEATKAGVATVTSFPSGLNMAYTRNYYNESTRTSEYDGITGNVVGVFLQPYVEYNPKGGYSTDNGLIVIDDITYADIAEAKGGKYSFAVTKMVPESQLKGIVKWSYDNNAKKTDKIDTHYAIKAGPTELLGMVNDLLEGLSSVFLWVGLGLAVFAGLLMMNYIATTISYKKREIGILRAVGARSVDVFGIFFNESSIIAFINFVLASVSTYVTVYYINQMLRDKYNITLTILNFGIRQIGLIFLIALGVAALASAIPVFNIARKKPIDAIRSE